MINYNDYLKKAKEMEDSYSNKIIEYKGTMNSVDFNENYRFIKRKLDELYEKTRVIQNISEYTRTFLRTQITSQKENLYELLKAAETTRDSLKRNGYKTKTILFAEDLKEKRIDRDGVEMAPASVVQGKITLLGKEEESVPIKKLTIDREIALSVSNNKDILKNEPIRNMYILDGPATNGVSETYKLDFEKESYVSIVNVENVNCDITGINLIDTTNKKIQVTEQAATGFKRQLAISAEVSITDKTYRQVTYEYDAMRMSSDFWHKVTQKEYATEMGLSYSFDLDSESGLKQYREDYAAYQSALSAWTAEKAAVDSRNAAAAASYENAYSSWQSTTSSIQASYERALSNWSDGNY